MGERLTVHTVYKPDGTRTWGSGQDLSEAEAVEALSEFGSIEKIDGGWEVTLDLAHTVTKIFEPPLQMEAYFVWAKGRETPRADYMPSKTLTIFS